MAFFFKRKTKNRRFDPSNVLEVKLRSNQVRANRFRAAGIVFTALFVVVFAAFCVWHGGEWLLNTFVYENNAFAIETIEIQTDGSLSKETLRKWAMVKPGDNLLALDLRRVKRDLELSPWIRGAAVERILPKTLQIRVSERDAVAQVVVLRPNPNGASEQFIYEIDEEGYVMQPLEPAFRSAPPTKTRDDLPFLTGVPPAELRAGRPVDSAQIKSALRLIGLFDFSPMSTVLRLERIDVSTPQVLQAYTRPEGEITFALDGFDTQLRRWRQIYEYYQKSGKAISSLDLSISNNIPLRWVDASGSPPPATKPVKTLKTKKKHV
jgi:hypothetical protein